MRRLEQRQLATDFNRDASPRRAMGHVRPQFSGLRQSPCNQNIAVRCIVHVRHRRPLARLPAPRDKLVVAHHQIGARPRPDALKRDAIIGGHGEQHAVALPLAMADEAVGGVDDAACGRYEALFVLLPQVRRRQRAAKRQRAPVELQIARGSLLSRSLLRNFWLRILLTLLRLRRRDKHARVHGQTGADDDLYSLH